MAGTARARMGFAPPELKRFLRRRLQEIAGLLVIALSALALAAVATHNPADPSWNVATGTPATNLLGLPGAVIADLALQIMGPVSLLLFAIPLCHGVREVVHQRAGRLRLRGLAWVTGGILAATGFALGAPDMALEPMVTGGLVGTWISGLVLMVPELPPLGYTALAAGFTFLGLGLLVVASAIPLHWFGAPFAWAIARAFNRSSGKPAAQRKTARSWSLPSLPRVRLPRISLPTLKRAPREDTDERAEPTIRPSADGPKKTTAPAAKPARKAKAKPAPKDRKVEPELDLEPEPDLEDAGDLLPPLSLLYEPTAADYPERASDEELQANARMLESVLEDFGVKGEITDVRAGPVVTLYELKPAPGTKSSRVIGLADDIARSMSAISARVAVVPGRDALGIELPNSTREVVYFREMLTGEKFHTGPGTLTMALGKDIGGSPVFADLARMPHLLIAGTTGSGKSVAVNTMILSLLYRLRPEQCRMIMIDPKMLELSVYEGIPHLLTPVVTDPKKAVVALKWAVKEMEQRYRRMSELNVRNIAAFNERLAAATSAGESLTKRVQTGFDPESSEAVFEDVELDSSPMPQIVIIVDEMADLMLVAGKDIEGAIQRLAQMARAAGIHLIMATQRPSVDVITGTIKANFPTRISFSVTSKIDSRTILGEQGAEQLLGQGDMLYQPNGTKLLRVHGPFVSDSDVERIAKWISKTGRPEYLEEVTRDDEEEEGFKASGGSIDEPMFDEAVEIVARAGKASTSFIQRQLKIGYNRAAGIIDEMEAQGMVSEPDHKGKREVLLRNPDEE
ncbi:MAG: DNA translocase FtsK 4TM domain-containing protein [Minwuia sp.]|nr:DNA translocase FtsK 4TM domain-containing protein [Minwuia sp.]